MYSLPLKEIMCRHRHTWLHETETLNSYFEKSSDKVCYVVNDREELTGKLNSGHILKYLAPSLVATNTTAINCYMERIKSIKLGDVATPAPKVLNIHSSLGEVLEQLTLAGEDSLPVIDDSGQLIGEVCADCVMDSLMNMKTNGKAEHEKIPQAV